VLKMTDSFVHTADLGIDSSNIDFPDVNRPTRNSSLEAGSRSV